MCAACGVYGPTKCDNCTVNNYCNYPPSACASPTPTPTTPQDCQAGGDYWSYEQNTCLYPDDCTNSGGTLNFAEGTCDGESGGGGTESCDPPDYYDPNFGTCVYVGDIGSCSPYAYLTCIDSMGWYDEFCQCHYDTPIIVDVLGDGFDMTDTAHGVRFTFEPGGTPDKFLGRLPGRTTPSLSWIGTVTG